jgi:indole-3-acetate monooxygenase
MRSIGFFRLFVPKSHGGLALDLPSGLRVIRALARLDGSVGWTASVANTAAIFATLLPRETYDRIYRSRPDVLIAGSGQPVGTAEATQGGFRVSGRWPFVSGCQHSDWMGALCLMTEGGKPLPGPVIRGFIIPAQEWQIEDTWHVAGLKATGSHHIAIKDELVPAANFFDFLAGEPCVPGPLYSGLQELLPLLHGNVSVGMAEGAVDDLVALANTGRQQQRAATPMRESETFQGGIGRIVADLRAARALLEAEAETSWRRALAGTLKSEAHIVEATQAGIWLSETAMRIGDACFTLGGSGALYETSPLPRRLRDLHTAAQHAAVHPRHYPSTGKLVLDSAVAEEKSAAA